MPLKMQIKNLEQFLYNNKNEFSNMWYLLVDLWTFDIIEKRWLFHHVHPIEQHTNFNCETM